MPADPRIELEALLAESATSADARRAETFDRLAGDRADRMALFGAGGLGRTVLAHLRGLGVEPLAFVDNDASLHGTVVDGLEVVAPSDAVARLGDPAFVVTTMRGCVGGPPADEVREQMTSLGAGVVIPAGLLFWKHADAFLPYYFVGRPSDVIEAADDVRRAYDLMADDRSRAEFVAHVRCRLTLDYRGTPPDDIASIYFPDDLVRIRDDEVFVDCGAFDGDALRGMIERSGGAFRRAIAYEPDPSNFARLVAFVAGLPGDIAERVTLARSAVGAHDGTAHFSDGADVQSAIVSEGGIQVPCVRLDAALAGAAPTFIKMDIEGGEADALAGARAIIREHEPLLAVSAYHRPADVWELPLLIHEMAGDCTFHLRPYMDACWDTVCYAIPKRRDERWTKS